MRDSIVRAAGLTGTALYGAAIVWMYAAQPQTVAEVTGGLTSTIGAYRVDQMAFDDGLAFFKRDQFDEARAALSRADPAGRDPLTQVLHRLLLLPSGLGAGLQRRRALQERVGGGRPIDRARGKSPARGG